MTLLSKRHSIEVTMPKSPGHKKWPEHQVREEVIHDRILVSVNGELVADSNDVIKVVEDGYPDRYYFPREHVDTEKLTNSDLETDCPFKGHARYYNLKAGHVELKDAVWTYLEPFDEHSDLRQRLAFYNDKMPEIEVRYA